MLHPPVSLHNPHLAHYRWPRLPHLYRNAQFLLCPWIFKFRMDSEPSEGTCIYQFNARQACLIINHHRWQLAMLSSPRGLREPPTTRTTEQCTILCEGKKQNRQTTQQTNFSQVCWGERKTHFYSGCIFPWLYILTQPNMPEWSTFHHKWSFFFMTMCAGVWHTVPLACYTQMSNSLCNKCVLAGGKKKGYGHRYGTSPCACVCVNVWPMLHRLRHSHTRRAAPFLLQPLANTHSPRKLLPAKSVMTLAVAVPYCRPVGSD